MRPFGTWRLELSGPGEETCRDLVMRPVGAGTGDLLGPGDASSWDQESKPLQTRKNTWERRDAHVHVRGAVRLC